MISKEPIRQLTIPGHCNAFHFFCVINRSEKAEAIYNFGRFMYKLYENCQQNIHTK